MINDFELLNDTHNPLDGMEEMFHAYEWSFDRIKDNELKVKISGRYADYTISLIWNGSINALLFCGEYDFSIPEAASADAATILMLANKECWIGCFLMDDEQRLPTFQHTCLFRGFVGSENHYIEEIINIVVFECDRFYNLFKGLSENAFAGDIREDEIRFLVMDAEGHS